MEAATVVATVIFVLACCATDLRQRRIPNALSGTALLGALLLNVCTLGAAGVVHSLAGVAIAVGVLLGPFALGGIGGGDVKMMAAIGALLGPAVTVGALIVGFILGGIIMIVHLTYLGRLREKLAALYNMIVAAALQRSFAPVAVSSTDSGAIALPYSVPLGLATLLVLLIARTGMP